LWGGDGSAGAFAVIFTGIATRHVLDAVSPATRQGGTYDADLRQASARQQQLLQARFLKVKADHRLLGRKNILCEYPARMPFTNTLREYLA
jgi:hypothetical protein